MVVSVRTWTQRPCQLQILVDCIFLHFQFRMVRMVYQNMLAMIYNKVSIHIDLLTRTICLCSNPTLQSHQEVLQILLQLSGNWQPRILAYGSLIEMALLMSMLAQAEVHMFWLVLTIVDMGEALMVIGCKIVVQLELLLLGLKLEKQWVIFLSSKFLLFIKLKQLKSSFSMFMCFNTVEITANMYSELREEARDHARLRNAYFEQVYLKIFLCSKFCS